MALRVLLADESVTIKKVIQLALQDFAVEVKAVPVGLDVLEVSKSFQPDLVFADILLQKRSGYEVCSDLKKDPTTAAIPVILMWSSFMELDQRMLEACGADGKLEKPFEVEALRKLVLELVPRTRSQRLAHFLEYPPSLAAPLRAEARAQEAKTPAAPMASSAPKPISTSSEPKPHPGFSLDGPLSGGTSSGFTASGGTASGAKPKMPPPLQSTPRAAPASNPFSPNFDSTPTPKFNKKPVAPSSASANPSFDQTPTPTPGIPDRLKPAGPPPGSRDEESGVPTATNSRALPKTDAPLGALPDLQLEGSPAPNSQGSSGWNMDSFEPLDLAPLTMGDDDDDAKESFQPIQLPQAEPSPSPLSLASTLGASLSLTNDDDEDADADQWANRSLDKYRLPPLKPDESLAVDDMTPDFAAEHRATPPVSHDSTMSLTTDKTEIIPPTPKKTAPLAKPADDVPQFSLSDDDVSHTARLEIEKVDQAEKARPPIVRELLRDPDFSFGDETVRKNPREESPRASAAPRASDRFDRTMAGEGVIDLSSAGTPSKKSAGDNDALEEMVRQQIAPQLEKVVEKIVSQLLPQIAERIIKRELERLLEES